MAKSAKSWTNLIRCQKGRIKKKIENEKIVKISYNLVVGWRTYKKIEKKNINYWIENLKEIKNWENG